MKKTLLFVASVLVIAFSNAQSFTLTDESGNDITGITVDYPTAGGASTIEPHIYATNISAEEKNLKVKKIYVSVIEGTENSFCYAGNCFGPETFISQSYYTLQPNEAIPHGQELHPIFEHNKISGTSTITYTYFDALNEDDSAYVTINYIYPADVVNNLEKATASISNAYPNPATNFTNIDVDLKGASDAKVLFFNVLGEEIYRQEITKSNETLQINTTNWASGIYYYSLINNSHNLSTKKLIINH